MKKLYLITATFAAMTTLNVYGAAFDDAPLFGGKPVSSLKGTLIRQELKNNLLRQIPDSYFESQKALTQLFSDHMGIKDLNDVVPDIAQEFYLYKAETIPLEKLERVSLLGEKRARAYAALTLMPEWLRPHFPGVSIQDLIDHKALPKFTALSTGGILYLNDLNINDLTGIQKIPDIDKVFLLSLTDNLITAISFKTFINLNNLQYLLLLNNQITDIAPSGFAYLDKLEHLDLQNNPVKTIMPEVFASLKALKMLNLEGTGISETERARIKAEVGCEVVEIRR